MRKGSTLLTVLLLRAAFWSLVPVVALAQEADVARDAVSLLEAKCLACHGPTQMSGLDMRQREALLKGGSRGPAIKPGDAKNSLLYQAAAHLGEVKMPPGSETPLPAAELAVLRKWIEAGAPWPEGLEQGSEPNWWSFRKLQRPAVPRPKNASLVRNTIDAFILAKLEEKGLKPAAPADKRTLLRRAYYDLIGLPPTPEQVDRFLKDTSPDAFEKVIQELLASPRYGERMAARWLDAARYADTNGYSIDAPRSMWRWRDWVIEAFNRNMPFDQFTVEQIAGDLLPGATRDQIIATGFNRNHRTNGEGGIVEEEFRVEYVADRVETTSTVWLGLTMGCARCHDHKYDPIRQTEYYQLFAYFNNIPERGLVYNYGNDYPMTKAPTPEHKAKLRELDQKAAATERNYQQLQQELAQAQRRWEKWLRDSQTADCSIREGLVLHYPLDGDLSPGATGWVNAKASVAGADDKTLPFVPGKIEQAAQFDGKRHIDAGDVANFDYLDPFSLAAWIYPTAADGAIVSREHDYTEAEGYGLYLKDGKIWLHITKRWTDYSLRLQTKTGLELNQWHHVITTYDGKRKGSGVKIYVDGEAQPIEILFDELNTHLGAKEPFRIGAGGGPQNRFRGYIDDVRVYNRALSEEEAAVLPWLETAIEIAAMPPARRTPAQANKLAICFIETAAPYEIQKARREMLAARAKREEYYKSIPTVMVMQEMEKARETFVLRRGAYDAPGEKVSPGVPAVLPPLQKDWPQNRLGLARWLVDRSNPLTARVTVNRFWQMLFGVGLVKTAEDFGSQGEWPVHPELLDWLAAEFMESGWNVKGLLKTIVTSATYRQSSKVTPALLERDPENRLLSRAPRVRLSAEMLRDQALAVSGLLVEKLGGPSVKPYQPPGLWEELSTMGSELDRYVRDKGEALYRRSLYTFWKRTVPPPAMVAFDTASREYCSVREGRTNTPLQALNLMNDVTYVEASRKLAERMMKEGGGTPEERIAYAFRLATARFPKTGEVRVLHRAFQKFLSGYQADPEAAVKLLSHGDSSRDESLDVKELASYAGVASLVLNLDETMTKE